MPPQPEPLFESLIAHLPPDECKRIPARADRLIETRNKSHASLNRSKKLRAEAIASLGRFLEDTKQTLQSAREGGGFPDEVTKATLAADQAEEQFGADLGEMRAAARVLASLCPMIPEQWHHLGEMHARGPVPLKEDNEIIVGGLSAFRDFVLARVAASAPAATLRLDLSRPDTVARWAKVWGVSPRAMGKILRTGQVRSNMISRQSYQVAIEDIPAPQRRRFQQPP
jgi:hypothetical protein